MKAPVLLGEEVPELSQVYSSAKATCSDSRERDAKKKQITTLDLEMCRDCMTTVITQTRI